MQHTLSFPPRSAPDLDVSPTFNVLIVYEDFETGKHAKRIYDFLIENLGHEVQFSNQMWKFDVLNLPKLREIARGDAAAADIVVVSCHGQELPEAMRSWMESWAFGVRKPLALVALFDPPREGTNRSRAVHDYLAELARKVGMELFAQVDETSNSRLSQERLGLASRTEDLGQRTLATLAGVVQREGTSPRWNLLEQ